MKRPAIIESIKFADIMLHATMKVYEQAVKAGVADDPELQSVIAEVRLTHELVEKAFIAEKDHLTN